ncbi:cereblon family protein [Desulfonatronovibrio hydrogenovorans]|uniref:cereblon family protein n=1 Tax=Desulfonatronovibrio hydrogenovorans TaxID=53245 RepID=UPI000691DC93|nr:cereblon family protein [Desulfonatronovibrio hydrogenovorans]
MTSLEGRTTLLFKTRTAPGFTPDSITLEDDQERPGKGQIICSLCRAIITEDVYAVNINGSHAHVFVNPQGLVFEVGCFSKAENITGLGPVTEEFTWFPGYFWQTALCTACRTQLGWIYSGSESGAVSFFGFILDRLIRE